MASDRPTPRDAEGRESVKLSICISYYNALDYLCGCLDSIEGARPSCCHEVLVVDDASERSCADIVRRDYPWAEVLVNAENLGFAATNNRAWRTSKGRYVLFLNTDTEVAPGALEALVARLDSEAERGAVGPMILNTDGSFQPQCHRGRLTPLTGLTYSLRLDRVFPDNRTTAEYLMRYADRGKAHRVKGLSGACMMVRRDVLEATGGFDESLVQYGEDLDLCYRIGEAGWSVEYEPAARVVHHGGKGGTNIRYLRSLYYFHRALWMLFRRHTDNPGFSLYAWFVLLMLGVRFLGAASLLLVGKRRAGTRKGARRFLPDDGPPPSGAPSGGVTDGTGEGRHGGTP